MTTRRLRTSALLAAAACLWLASPTTATATATKLPGKNRQATFRVSIEGVQTTTWVENHQSQGGRCDYTETGQGSERVVFSSRPVVIKAWQFRGVATVFFLRGKKNATLPGRGSVTRTGTLERGALDPSCAVGDGGDESAPPPASDCGRKPIASLPLDLGYDPKDAKRITVYNASSKTGPDYEHCPRLGEGWTTILRGDDTHGSAGQELPAADLFDKRQGKMIVLGKGTIRRTAMDVTYTVRIKWTLTLRRLRG